MDNMVGKKMFMIDGPGQSPIEGLCTYTGSVKSEYFGRFGDYWVVLD